MTPEPHMEAAPSWEKRSQIYGCSLQGVLFKNLPEIVNEHIHQWHVHAIRKFFHGRKPKNLLDVGCGYGRLSASLIKQFPDIEAMGLDVSPHYVELYHQNLKRPAMVASLEELPDSLGQFDCILAVTVLMYLPKENLLTAVTKLIKHLDKDGFLVIIERHGSGSHFQNPFGLRDRFKGNKRDGKIDTGGQCFTDAQIRDLARWSGGEVIKRLKMPLTTIFILPIYVLAKILPKFLCRPVLKLFLCLDKILGPLNLPTLHAAYLIRKK